MSIVLSIPMTVDTEIKTRNEITAEDQWDLQSLFPSAEQWENAFSHILESKTSPHWPSLQNYQGKLHEGAPLLKSAIEQFLSIEREIEKLHTYAHLKLDEEITSAENKSRYERISLVAMHFREESAFFEPELLSLPQSKIDSYLNSSELASYKFFLEKLVHLRPHILSAEQEKLLAQVGQSLQTSSKAFSALNNADLQFGSVEDSSGKMHPLSQGLYQIYLRHPDRSLRAAAFSKMLGTYEGFKNTFCELIQGQIQNHLFVARARNYTAENGSACLEAALDPHHISPQVYHSLISAVRSRLPTLHRYVQCRKQALKLDQLHLYDMYVPLVPNMEISFKYAEAEEMVVDSVAPLGKEYQNLLRKGLLEERWVDRYENKNKRSGAYSSGCFDSHPYILMNFRGTLRDVFTLAHEAGHSMHSLLSRTSQPYHYSHYPIFVAEVASTFNEELLFHLLLNRTTDPQKRAFLIVEKLEDIRATLFRQTLFAEFELKLHTLVEQGVPLTPDLLKQEYHKLNVEYYGPDVIIDEEIDIEWARIPHFYYNFYVYQYATGISAALQLAHRLLNASEGERPKLQESYLNFLKGGGSAYPIELLKRANVDITTEEPVHAAIALFDRLLNEFSTLTKS